jgi:aspartate 4-decarboxylase
MLPETYDRIVKLVREKRPDLIILTDDVYGTFIDGFRSLAADLPHNTILVYSYSKLYGCTGVRLGVVGVHEDNIFDRKIAELPLRDRQALHHRYASITEEPENLRFIDRMVADSRDVALNHTAGLSLPQQTQLMLFSLFTLLDEGDAYIKRCRHILRERLEKLAEGLGIPVPEDAMRVGYYVDLDLIAWGRKHIGEDFVRYVEAHHQPLDVVLALAHRYGTVLLNGSGFEGPAWSVRVSLANLETDDYATIGRNLASVMRRAIDEWRGEHEPSPKNRPALGAGQGLQGTLR